MTSYFKPALDSVPGTMPWSVASIFACEVQYE